MLFTNKVCSSVRLLNKLLLCICLTWLPVSRADDIRVVTEYLHTFQLKLEDGTLGGYATEVVNALFELTDDNPKIEILPWARAYSEALIGKNVMIFSIAKTPLRSDKFNWIGTLSHERIFVWGLKTNFTQPVTELDQLREYIFATSRSSNPEQYLTSRGFKKIFRVGHQRQALGMLFKNRADLIFSTELSLRYRTKQAKLDFNQLTKVFEIQLLNNELCIAFSQSTDMTLINRYKQAFTKLEESGVINSLRDKWQVSK